MPAFAKVRSMTSATNPPAFVKVYPMRNTAEDKTHTYWRDGPFNKKSPDSYKFFPYKGIITRRNDPITDMSNMFEEYFPNTNDIQDPDLGLWDTSLVTNMASMFKRSNFNQDISGWNTSNVTAFAGMFSQNGSFNQPIGNWNTSKCTNMASMFYESTSFDQDIGSWDVSKVTDMGEMFVLTPFNQDIGDWNTSNLERTYRMFFVCSNFDQELRYWDLSKVTNGTDMFLGLDSSSWTRRPTVGEKPIHYPLSNTTEDPTNVSWTGTASGYKWVPNKGIYTIYTEPITDMTEMFKDNLTFNDPDISTWDVSTVTTMSSMFRQTQFDQDIGGWDVSSVNDFNFMFADGSFNQDLSGWNTSGWTDTDIAPVNFQSPNLPNRKMPLFGRDPSQYNFYPISNSGATDPTSATWRSTHAPPSATWISDRGYVTNLADPITDMSYMFQNNASFNDPDIVEWTVSNVINMQFMFNNATAFNQNIGSWNTELVTDMSYIFRGAAAFDQDIGGWNVRNVTSMREMFRQTPFNQNIGNWNVSSVTDMYQMFAETTSFNQDINGWNVSSVTNMGYMFANNPAFNQNIGGWNVGNVTNMEAMFSAASAFNQDISGWDVRKVISFTEMFASANAFNQDLRWWHIGAVYPVLNDSNFNSNAEWTTKPLFGVALNSAGGLNYYPLTNSTEDPTSSTWRTNSAPGYRFKANIGIYSLPDNPITDMQDMFIDNATFNDPDIANWDTSSVTNMRQMFQNAVAFNQDISSWDVRSVTDMQVMFSGATAFNQDLRWWNVTATVQNDQFDELTDSGWTNKPLWGIPVNSAGGLNYYPLTNTATDPTHTAWRTNVGISYKFKENQGIYTLPEQPITTMHSMFSNNTTFNDPDISTWDVSSVTNMAFMFADADVFNQDISGWDVSSVIGLNGMEYMFYRATAFNQDLTSWNTSNMNVDEIPELFADPTTTILPTRKFPLFGRDGSQLKYYPITDSGWNQGLISTDPTFSTWRSTYAPSSATWIPNRGYITDITDPITNMSSMFEWDGSGGTLSTFNDPDLQYWDTSAVTSMVRMFYDAQVFNQNIGSWNVGNVTDMNNMLFFTFAFNQDIGDWDVSKVTNMHRMFYGAQAFNQNLNNWNTGLVTDMSSMFGGAWSFNGNISNWNTSSVINMEAMFYSALPFNQDITGWDTSSVTNMKSMFSAARAFNKDISIWNVTSVTDMSFMFATADVFNQDLRWWDVSAVTNTTDFDRNANTAWTNKPLFGVALNSAGGLNYYPLTNTATDPTSVVWQDNFTPSSGYRFHANKGIYTLPSEPITTMNHMFYDNSSFNDLDIGSWNVSSVTNTNNMFQNATAFNQDIGGWDVSSVTNMQIMFNNAQAFNQDIGNWNVSNVTDMSNMFANADVFNQDISGWNVSSVIVMYSMFYNATAFNQDLSGWNTSNSVQDTFLISSFAAGDTALPLRKFPLFGRDGSQLKYYPITNSGATDPTNSTWRTTYAPSSATWIDNRGYITDIADPITDMSSMFEDNSSFNDPDLEFWNVGTVTNMSNMFQNASAFNQDISYWDVSSVTQMANLFNGNSIIDQDLRWWDVSLITNTPPDFSSNGSWTNLPLFGEALNTIAGLKYYPLTNTATDPTNSTWRSTYAPPSGYRFRANKGIYTLPNEPIRRMDYMFKDNTGYTDSDLSLWKVASIVSAQYWRQGTSIAEDLTNWYMPVIDTGSEFSFSITGSSVGNDPLKPQFNTLPPGAVSLKQTGINDAYNDNFNSTHGFTVLTNFDYNYDYIIKVTSWFKGSGQTVVVGQLKIGPSWGSFRTVDFSVTTATGPNAPLADYFRMHRITDGTRYPEGPSDRPLVMRDAVSPGDPNFAAGEQYPDDGGQGILRLELNTQYPIGQPNQFYGNSDVAMEIWTYERGLH